MGVKPLSDSEASSRPSGDSVKTCATEYSRSLKLAIGLEGETAIHGRNGSSVAVASYTSPVFSLQVPALDVSHLSVNLSAARVTGGIACERARSFQARRHSMFLAPAGAAMRWRKPLTSRHLSIYFRTSDAADDVKENSSVACTEAGRSSTCPCLDAAR